LFKSRLEVLTKLKKKIQQGLSVCIFPEGQIQMISIVLDTFKDGAFPAIEHQIPIVPITFGDNKRRFSDAF
jgi:1-acyl-sn-glycerol-3-phosphate acyltransferase